MASIGSSSKDPVPETQPTSATPSFIAPESAYGAMLGRGTAWYTEFIRWAGVQNSGSPQVFLMLNSLSEDLSALAEEHMPVAKWLHNCNVIDPEAYQVVQRAVLENTKLPAALAEAEIAQGSSTVAVSGPPQVKVCLRCSFPSVCWPTLELQYEAQLH